MSDTPLPVAQRRRLDQRVAPGWANLCSNLLRGGGILVGALLLGLGFLTGGFFIVLTGVLGVTAIAGGWVLAGLIQRESWYESGNAQVKSWALVVGFPLLLVVFAQVAGPLLAPPPTTGGNLGGGELGAGEQVFQLALDPRIEQVEFSLWFQANDGPLRWYVEDPSGNSQWSGRSNETGTDRQRFSSDRITSIGGQWLFHVVNEGGYAEYSADWQGWTSP